MTYQNKEALNYREHPAKSWSGTWDFVPGEHRQEGLQQNFHGEAGTYVVQLSMNRRSPQSPSVTVVTAEALISFSCEGNTTTRRVSISPGMSIAGNCEHIVVRVMDTSAPAILPDVINETYTLTVLVSKGNRASIDQPPTLVQGVNQSLLAGGATSTFPVPQDAGVISVFVDVSTLAGAPLADNGVQVEQLTDAAATFILKSYDPRDCCWVPLAPACTMVRIRNRTAAQIIAVRTTFGIDG